MPFTTIILKLIAAFIIILVGFVIGRSVSNLLERLLIELEFDKIVKKRIKLSLIVSGSRYLIYLAAIIIALNQLKITKIILTITIMIVASFFIIFLLLSVKDLIINSIAGSKLHKIKKIKVDDSIRLGQLTGKIIDITPTDIKVRTKNNNIIIIPNSVLLKSIKKSK